ncbi:hypothetical protein RJT34_23130 [Clitoria ternatea]|uniref:Uncharacterized protein n=1 Tax=Clitoria ternatea TaxID=43366 RepID=A0AAN9FL15_CLITE
MLMWFIRNVKKVEYVPMVHLRKLINMPTVELLGRINSPAIRGHGKHLDRFLPSCPHITDRKAKKIETNSGPYLKQINTQKKKDKLNERE